MGVWIGGKLKIFFYYKRFYSLPKLVFVGDMFGGGVHNKFLKEILSLFY